MAGHKKTTTNYCKKWGKQEKKVNCTMYMLALRYQHGNIDTLGKTSSKIATGGNVKSQCIFVAVTVSTGITETLYCLSRIPHSVAVSFQANAFATLKIISSSLRHRC